MMLVASHSRIRPSVKVYNVISLAIPSHVYIGQQTRTDLRVLHTVYARTKTNERSYIKTLQSISLNVCVLYHRLLVSCITSKPLVHDRFTLLLCETRVPSEFSAHS